jgi:tetratricopeptide (TPR) repeat protein
MQFRFPLTNDLIGKAAVTESLADASCFFVAVGFTVQGRFLDARGIWEGLRRKLQMIPNTTRLQTLARLSQRWWEMNELLYCRQRLYREILPAITRPEGHAVAKECERIITVLRQANPKDPNFVLQHAILHFHFGDIQKARRDSEEAEELTNHEDPAPYFSLAFIALWQGKAKVALRHYRKVHRLGPPTAMVLGVLHFLEHVAAVHRDKSALRFALAIVNDLFFDQERAKKDYRDFLAMTKNDAESSDLIVHAQDRLAALSASEDSAVGIEATAPAI